MDKELPWWLRGKESAYQCRRLGFNPWSGKIPHTTEQALDPMDCSPPGSSIHGSFQARVLEWGAMQ